MARTKPAEAPRMETREEKEALARRYAPLLIVWPEIPALAAAASSMRDSYSRPEVRWASRPTGGAHITRDFHPCDVRLILNHAQAWEPDSSLPMVPLWFSRAYRDLARFLFWPIAALVLISLLMLAFAQGLPDAARRPVEIGILALAATLYLVMLRSPILVPVDYWHHLNHAVVGLGVVVAWGTVFGTRELWWLGPIIAVPTLLSFLTSIAIRIVAGLTNMVLGLLQRARDILLRLRVGRIGRQSEAPHTSLLFHGLKAAHEYTSRAELFYRDPQTRKPIHRSDQGAHWEAYSRIRARESRHPVYYARIMDPDEDGIRVIQYWFCYYYNDWANSHEGDWESAVVFVRDGRPAAVAASQHERGEYRECGHLEWRGDRPVLHVAAGSHALYFEAGAHFTERPIAGLQLTALDASLLGRDILDFVDFTAAGETSVNLDSADVILIPDPDPDSGRWGHLEHDPDCPGGCSRDFEWLNFPGHWGSAAVAMSLGGSGPKGPAFAGLKWDNPRIWARTMCRGCRSCEAESSGGANRRRAGLAD
jgi:hypothetical protein